MLKSYARFYMRWSGGELVNNASGSTIVYILVITLIVLGITLVLDTDLSALTITLVVVLIYPIHHYSIQACWSRYNSEK